MVDVPSSKSEKRFLVNFHTMKPMIPKSATPPATDRPMIVPVLTPELPPELELPVLLLDALLDEAGLGLTISGVGASGRNCSW